MPKKKPTAVTFKTENGMWTFPMSFVEAVAKGKSKNTLMGLPFKLPRKKRRAKSKSRGRG